MTWLLRPIVKAGISLRYRVRMKGLDEIGRRGRQGILFLPNHPAFIDPIILLAWLNRDFKPRALADRHQTDRFVIRDLAKAVNIRPMPDLARTRSTDALRAVREVIEDTIQGLKRGENALIYPSGRVYRSRYEHVGGNSAVETILQALPDVRVVLVRTIGLWGSRFSYAPGPPMIDKTMRFALLSLAANGIFFGPRRRVDVEFVEPDDLPRQADRFTINRYLERFYNQDAPPNTYVPYFRWEKPGPRPMPEPAQRGSSPREYEAGDETRRLVAEYLRELTGRSRIRDDDGLAVDLGLDSLTTADLATWLEKEFGYSPAPDALRTVGDVMLAAMGESAAGETKIAPPPAKWFAADGSPQGRLSLPQATTVAEAFLQQAQRHGDRAIVADAISGVRSYHDLVTACLALRPLLSRLGGEYLGIMLPAGVAAHVAYLATLFAGKTPVMINWTVGPRNLLHALETLGIQHVLTAEALVAKLKTQGADLSAVERRMVAMETLAKRVTPAAKLRAAMWARLGASALHRAKISPLAAVLFTSGSENLPKAVPLTHANVLANIAATTEFFRILPSDSLLGMLPPFHSFGLTATMILPLCTGLPVCHWPNPTEGSALATMVEQYRPTITVGTPTFLGAIARASTQGQLDSLRIAITGAERCPPRVYDALSRACPNAKVLEGYGITECSPIVAANPEDDPRAGTIGRVLPSFEYAVVDPQTGGRAAQAGMLLVRGPSVFGGYLHYDGPSPFTDFEGKSWYRTGDIVTDDGGHLTFVARLKRFAKLGGEMISLPAIEAVLLERFGRQDAEGPVLAVTASEGEHSELVLFTTDGVARSDANDVIAAAGLSPLHNIRRVVKLDALPVLGTGKVDYQALAKML